MIRGRSLAAALIVSLPLVARAQTDRAEFFETKIRPLLANNCYGCHSEVRTSGLRVDSRQDLIKGGNSGAAIVPGDPNASLLIQAVAHTHSRLKMPPGKKLSDAEIADLRSWVQAGAPWPEAPAAVTVTSAKERVITDQDRSFWSFRPLQRPSPPAVKNASWLTSAGTPAIDRFVLAKLEERGLEPVRAADRRTLLRRATFDLTGLPPTREEVDAFVKDTSPQAFERVVDRLLASPHFGERWARYWLDVARYGEDDIRGLSRESYPFAWRYRDWVIKAFNQDMPYDEFVKAQIAADLIASKRDDLAGLGFFGLGPWYYDITVPPQARADERHDRVDAVSRGFLGLTVACARCHDHKFDPISTKDYYAIAGVFGSSEYHQYPLAAPDTVNAYEARVRQVSEKESEIADYTKSLSDTLALILARQTASYVTAAWNVLGPAGAPVPQVAAEQHLNEALLNRWVKYLGANEREHPFLKKWDELRRAKSLDRETQKSVSQLAQELQTQILNVLRDKKQIDEENRIALGQRAPKKRSKTQLPNGFASYDEFCPGCDVEVKALERDRYFLWRDLFSPKKGEEAQTSSVLRFEGKDLEPWLSGEWKANLESLQKELKQLKDTMPEQYPYLHGISDSETPGNLRVHLRGSPYNLGDEVPRRFLAVLATEPKPFAQGSGRLELAEAIAHHPLAARVMANRIWEHLFGAGIVATPSNFGKMGQLPTHPELLEYLGARFVDGRYSMKSLIREIVLSSTYRLSSENSQSNFAQDPDNRLHWRMSRRRLDVESLRDSILFVSGSLSPQIGGASVDLSNDMSRRTIYGRISRFKLDQTLALFDFPSPSSSSEKRNVTNVPLQRLFYLNSDFVWSQANALAKRTEAAGTGAPQRIATMYSILFGRDATPEEIHLGEEFLAKSQWAEYAQILLGSNEFEFVD